MDANWAVGEYEMNPYPTTRDGAFNWAADPDGVFYEAWKICHRSMIAKTQAAQEKNEG